MVPDLNSILESDTARREGHLATLRHLLLEGVLRRITALPDQERFVLRGGLLTRAWVAPLPRPTRDLDFVGDLPFDVGDVARRFAPILMDPRKDGIVLAADGLRAMGTWLHTDFPGVRITLAVGWGTVDQEITIDVGFGDPLVPSPLDIDYLTLSGDLLRVRAVRPETQLAWKLHGLAEQGDTWRPKDLADLWRIVRRVPLDATLLPEAIEAAFLSRGFSIEDALGILQRAFWQTKTARVRWATVPGAPDLASTLETVRAALAWTFTALANRHEPLP